MILVQCFFMCGHVEAADDPDAVHDAMEQHYQGEHALDLTQLLRGVE